MRFMFVQVAKCLSENLVALGATEVMQLTCGDGNASDSEE